MTVDRFTLLRMRVASGIADKALEEDQHVPKIVARAIRSLPKATGIVPKPPPPGLGTDVDSEPGTVAKASSAESCIESPAPEKNAEIEASSGTDSNGAILQDDSAVDRLQYAGHGPVPQLKDITGVWSDSLGHTVYVSQKSPIVQLHDPSGRVRKLRLVADSGGRLWCGNSALMHVGIAQPPIAGSWGVPIHLAWCSADFKISIWDRVQHAPPPAATRPASGSSRANKAEKGGKKQQHIKYPDVSEAIRAAPTPQGSKRLDRLEHNDE